DPRKKEAIRSISSLGCNVQYKQADIACKEKVAELLASIQKTTGPLHGIIHCAGVILDSLVLNKTESEWEKVLAPKVFGIENLDDATKDMPLDFFVSFSSLAGAMGNPGQADYAAANAFVDAFSGYRHSLV